MKSEEISKYLERPQEYEVYLEGVKRKARDWYSYYGRNPDLIAGRISQLEHEEGVLQAIVDGDLGNILIRKETIHAKLQVLRDLKEELWGEE
ncbi:MAG: hypothetical protein OXL40_05320 [Bacteroidota bacterium]|nr:hypothetical protein [Bacteroidota bacterium]